MKNITTAMNMYRECARNLWNIYFLGQMKRQSEWDISDEFDDICTLLFSSLILGPLDRSNYKKAPSYQAIPEPILILQVVPSAVSGVHIDINRDVKCSGYWDYPLNIIKPSEADLRFIDYFDFDSLGFRDFQYCRVRIVGSNIYPDIVGRDALLNSNHVDIFLDV